MTTSRHPGSRLSGGDVDLAPGAADSDVEAVRSSIVRLVERFRPSDARGVEAAWVIAVHRHQPYTIHVRDGRCLISPGTTDSAEATLATDAGTWLDIVAGRRDGIAAYLAGDLEVRGDLHLATRLETMFTPGPEATRLIRTLQTDVKGVRVESLVAGHGAPVLLIHGLAANKLSFLPTLHGLSHGHEVHALDLPGFGRSDKPLPGGRRYSARWMAEVVHGYLVRNRIRSAYIVGNSMGGRIATELALRRPRQVRGIVGLGPAVAFDEWQRLGPAFRWIQAEWAALAPWPLRPTWVESAMGDLFHDPSRLPPGNLRAGADDVLRSCRDRGYRLAVAAAARHLAGERATGRRGFWDRLADLQVPSMWIWGRHDRLVSYRYADRVRQILPHAHVEVWENIGHVPQFEDPERTNRTVGDFVARIEAGR